MAYEEADVTPPPAPASTTKKVAGAAGAKLASAGGDVEAATGGGGNDDDDDDDNDDDDDDDDDDDEPPPPPRAINAYEWRLDPQGFVTADGGGLDVHRLPFRATRDPGHIEASRVCAPHRRKRGVRGRILGSGGSAGCISRLRAALCTGRRAAESLACPILRRPTVIAACGVRPLTMHHHIRPTIHHHIRAGACC